MTLTEILSNEELRHHEFPVVRDKVFLAHAGVCPLPRRVSEAIAQYAQRASTSEQEVSFIGSAVETARHLAAQLLSAQPDEIALVGPTSLGLSLVASSFKWRRHSNIVAYLDDYPSNVYPWTALAEKGVQVRLIRPRQFGVISPVDVMEQVDENTRLVALASCHFMAGARLDHDAIGKFLRDRGILFCLDGIQTLGAFPTTVANLDFLAADSHKWLLGPCAAGILYVRGALQEKLHPPLFGWNNVRSPNFVAQEQLVYRTGPHRFEIGTHNLLGLMGLNAALELILEIGVNQISAELLRKRAWLVPALKAKGWQVLADTAPAASASAIISISHPEKPDLAALHAKLEKAGVYTSLRTDRAGRRYLRLSPHFYNTDAELHRLLDLL